MRTPRRRTLQAKRKAKITLNSEFAQTNEKLCMVFYRHRQQTKRSPLHRWQTATPQATRLETDGVVIDEETAATAIDSLARVPKCGCAYAGRNRRTATQLATAALRVAVVAVARNRSPLHNAIGRHFGSGTAATNPEQTQQRQHKQCDVGTMFHADKFTFFFICTQKKVHFFCNSANNHYPCTKLKLNLKFAQCAQNFRISDFKVSGYC